jgi:hypothetical protein
MIYQNKSQVRNIARVLVAYQQMMQVLHVKLNPTLSWQKQHLTRRTVHQQKAHICKEAISEVPHYENHFMVPKWEPWQSKSETFVKFRNVVLEKNGEDQFDRSCKK